MPRAHHPFFGPFLLAVAAAGAGMSGACLRDLDPALLEQGAGGCIGGTPNGVLEPGEDCDDANVLENDGCSPACELICDGLVDPMTGTCYVVASPEIEPQQAIDRCAELGTDAHVLSIQSDRERDLVVDWLSKTPLSNAMAGLYAVNQSNWLSFALGSAKPGGALRARGATPIGRRKSRNPPSSSRSR